MTPLDVARAALCEAGRPDLAAIVVWVQADDAAAVEVNDRILTEHEWSIVDRAEVLACSFAGIDPDRGLPENAREP